MKLKRICIPSACLVSAVVVLVAFFVADRGNNFSFQDVGRYILFPGLILETMVTGNIHGGSFLSAFLIILFSWLVWSIALQITIKVVSVLFRAAKSERLNPPKNE